jgi:phospholipase A1/A2
MNFFRLLIFITFLTISCAFIYKVHAQKLNKENKIIQINKRDTFKIEQDSLIIDNPTKQAYYTIYQDNYVITGTSFTEKPTKNNSDLKFQISFKIRTAAVKWLFNSYIYVTYTQKTFLDIYKYSFPLRENNYNPGLGIAKIFLTKTKRFNALLFQFEHESNGRDSITNRSWNRFSLQYITRFPHLNLSLKGWIPYAININYQNEGFLQYVGFGEASIYWKPSKKKRFIIDATIRKGNSWQLKGSIQAGIRWRPNDNWPQFLYLQFYNGYAENLLEYSQLVHKVRIGIVFMPTDLIPK